MAFLQALFPINGKKNNRLTEKKRELAENYIELAEKKRELAEDYIE